MIDDNMAPFGSRFDEKTQTALPPIPLLEDPHITFLADVGAVYREGQTMQHCIASYAGDAVQGGCYLFHIDYQDTTASTMIDARGRMVQSFGPRNVTNAASRYGAQVLGSWGMGFGTSTQTFSQGPQSQLERLQADIAWLMPQLEHLYHRYPAEHIAAFQEGVTQLMEEFQRRDQHTDEDFLMIQTAIAQLAQELRQQHRQYRPQIE